MASIVKSLRLLGDPTRLRLLLLLGREELSVAELQEILGMGQSRISSHLGQLKRAGLVRDRRSGKNIYYGAAEDVAGDAALGPVLQAAARELPETAEDDSALKLTLKKRRDQARTYFDRIAGRYGRGYCPGRSWEALAHLLLALAPPMVVADLGAGEGMLTQLLARRARKVIAIDSSENMVAYGSEMARQHGFRNIEYRLGDLEMPPVEANTVDVALLSQSLHHAASPARAIKAAHRIVRRGGRIAILDLHSHNHEQVRELYADLWLGFTEGELYRMLEQAGFREVEVSIVARETPPPHFQIVLATGVKS
jgi:ubiquinone/menaquinone biosynthesis C-methylase UbiE/DNA-binding transcriptional ArsR family regulator